MALFAEDSSCKISPLLYAPLISTVFVEVLFILNEGLILVISSRGSIWNNIGPRKHMLKLIFVRALIAVSEIITLIAATVGTWLPQSVAQLETCSEVPVALHFTRAVVLFLWIVYFCFLLKVLIYVDPLGCFSPGILEHISLLGDKTDLGEGVNSESVLAARQLSFWVSGRRLFRQSSGSATTRLAARRETVHDTPISDVKVKRRLGALFCCLCVQDERSVGGALEEVARGFYTIFGDSENAPVLTDIVAGMILVHHEQQRSQNLNDKFRKVGILLN